MNLKHTSTDKILFESSNLMLAVKKALGLGIVASALVGTAAQATEIEKIEITAQYRSQNIQEVPIAVTSLGAADIAKSDISDASSVANFIPGMTFAEFSPGQANISMRGINTSDDGPGLDNSVALFLDGVYIGRGASINFDMFDLERIEVLRGPQGTLFGRNAVGGAISVITAKPSDEFRAKVGATVGNDGILRYQGLVNGGLSDNLYGKLSVSHREHDGFVHNVLLDTELKDEDSSSVRGQLLYQGDSSEWLFTADYMTDDRADMGRTPVMNGNQDYLGELIDLGATEPRQSASPVDGFSKREAGGFSLTGTIDFSQGSLVTITALRHAETDWEMASIGAPLITGGGPTYDFGDPSTPEDDVYGIDLFDDIVEDIDTFSQEFRWVSNLDGNINYTAGLFFLTEETERVEQWNITRNTYAAAPLKLGNEYSGAKNKTTSYAAYGQGNWEINEQWSLTLGARYTVDEKDYTATSVNCALDATGTEFENFFECQGVGGSLKLIAESFSIDTSDDWNDLSPMANLKYQASKNVMFYTSVSRGFKSGGFAGSQGVESSASIPVQPEVATNYELGFKGDFLANTLRFNTTLFYTDYQDLQVTRFGPTTGSEFGTFQTTNVGEAAIQGMEVEFNWNLTDNFNMSGNYAYLDTEVKGLIFDTATGIVDGSGNPLRQAPENSYQLTLNYYVPIESGELDLRLEYSHTDEQNMSLTNTAIKLDESNLVNAKVSWLSPDDKLELSLWVKNLTDEAEIVHVYTIGPGAIGVWGDPRTFGVSATYSF
ncbi:MAG: iron complex outermembrane receptor protein [Paraglaciecola sp.]|jgi:iron complex outermembrane receptor protein